MTLWSTNRRKVNKPINIKNLTVIHKERERDHKPTKEYRDPHLKKIKILSTSKNLETTETSNDLLILVI